MAWPDPTDVACSEVDACKGMTAPLFSALAFHYTVGSLWSLTECRWFLECSLGCITAPKLPVQPPRVQGLEPMPAPSLRARQRLDFLMPTSSPD